MLDLLLHASQCRSPLCLYPNCRKVKGLFRHGINCKVRASGGCVLCKRMWYLLQLHARACKESQCHVPRCRSISIFKHYMFYFFTSYHLCIFPVLFNITKTIEQEKPNINRRRITYLSLGNFLFGFWKL